MKVVATVKPLGGEGGIQKHDYFFNYLITQVLTFLLYAQNSWNLHSFKTFLVVFLVWENNPGNTSNIKLHARQILPWICEDDKIIKNVVAKRLDKAYQFAKMLQSDVHTPWNCLTIVLDKWIYVWKDCLHNDLGAYFLWKWQENLGERKNSLGPVITRILGNISCMRMTYSAVHNHSPYSLHSWEDVSKQPQILKNNLKYFF